jgi:phosphoribosylaminoimidazolecarboxamide formyltransferase / IMP cyclohydrolase
MRRKVRRALISVYDKDRLIEIGQALSLAGVEIISTGSTAKKLSDSGIDVTEVSVHTGFPEILEGRVKTLHPRIHGAILADQSNSKHLEAIAQLEIQPFDLVIVNLYPFVQSVESGSTFQECLENIDIGGPTLLRAAAKNHNSVSVVSKISQYDQLLTALKSGGFNNAERRRLALEAFRTTAEYDLSVATWLAENDSEKFPDWFGRIWQLKNELRYGENPHQSASIYSGGPLGIVNSTQLHGKQMSFNNYTDADAAWRTALDHQQAAVVIMKHANPCGIAVSEIGISDAYLRAFACDPESAFGGVVAANRRVDFAMAESVSKVFTEVLIAPDFDFDALEILMKKPSIRIIKCDTQTNYPLELRIVSGGVLLQETDLIDSKGDVTTHWKRVCGDSVDDQTLKDLEFAWRSVRSVKSNAILLSKFNATVGIGMGQVNRVDAAKLAISRAGENAMGSVAASDGFFPFADGLQILIDAGVRAVVQPGGSIRDEEVIAAANAGGITMYFTDVRHFSHA